MSPHFHKQEQQQQHEKKTTYLHIWREGERERGPAVDRNSRPLQKPRNNLAATLERYQVLAVFFEIL